MHVEDAILILWTVGIPVIAIAGVIISIRIVTKLLKEPWGRVLVGVALVGLLIACVSLVLRFERADQTAKDFNDACRYAMDLALMNRLHSEYKSAPATQRPELQIRLLDACAQVKQDDWMAHFGPTRMSGWPRFPGSAYRLDEELRAADKVAEGIAFDFLEHPSSRKVRRAAFAVVLDWRQTDARIAKVLDSYRGRDEHEETLGGLGERGDRLIDFGLSELYYAKGEYAGALKMLESAFGADWAATGRVDKWWQSYLPLSDEDHLRFGYLFYVTHQSDRALREYRLARGAGLTAYHMSKAYAFPPTPFAND